MRLSELFQNIVSLSLLGSVTAAGLYTIKLLFGKKLSANWHYYIWFVLLLRLVIPFTPPSSFSVLNFLPQYEQTFNKVQEVTALPSIENTNTVMPSFENNTPQEELNPDKNSASIPPQTASFGLSWENAAFIWLSGVILILLYLIIVNGMLFLKFRKKHNCEDGRITKILEESVQNLRVNKKVAIVYDDAVKSPALLGILHPKIIISPQIIALLEAKELGYVFLHELSHLKRRDLLFNIIGTFLQVIYWFNPIIWFALYQMKQDCEIACDYTALASVKPEEHKKYACTIINILRLISKPKWAPGTIGFASKFNTRRIIMISMSKKTTLKWAVAALALTFIVGCASLSQPINPANNNLNQNNNAITGQQNTNEKGTSSSSSSSDTGSIVYQNTQYAFNFLLPNSWQDYSIINSKWEGLAIGGQQGEKVLETGPMISIRHPQWTKQNPRLDIPIMVFTLAQWNELQQGKFHIGAAPVGPSELGRNPSYVFALPARYNYAFPTGYEEVEKILQNSPLQTTQTDPVRVLLLNMLELAKQGKVINSDFPAKITTIDTVEKAWGKPDQSDYIAAAKGTYANFNKYKVAFGVNKGGQVFEVRFLDRNSFASLTLSKVKEVLGKPDYDSIFNGEEIIGYKAGTEFKLEFIFSQAAANNSNPTLDHYNVLYPQGTVNTMADDPGRQW